MADMNSIAPSLLSFGAKLGSLRSRRPSSIIAALRSAAPPPPVPAALPALKGRELARHHLSVAIDALGGPGVSKPEAFRTLRLLLNTLEQGPATPAEVRNVPAVVPPRPSMSRRARLLNKAFESANLMSGWRNPDRREN